LLGSLIAAGGALFAAGFAWRAVMNQIESDKQMARDSQRAIVHGGLGGRVKKDGVETAIVFSGQNTGKTPAFTKKIYWGACKASQWPTICENWIEHTDHREWEEILPPEMKPAECYVLRFTTTLIPDDGENYVCYGRIVYIDLFGEERTTSWKHQVVREGPELKSYGLPGGYSTEWERSG
jgi:hypothetical protein